MVEDHPGVSATAARLRGERVKRQTKISDPKVTVAKPCRRSHRGACDASAWMCGEVKAFDKQGKSIVPKNRPDFFVERLVLRKTSGGWRVNDIRNKGVEVLRRSVASDDLCGLLLCASAGSRRQSAMPTETLRQSSIPRTARCLVWIDIPELADQARAARPGEAATSGRARRPKCKVGTSDDPVSDEQRSLVGEVPVLSAGDQRSAAEGRCCLGGEQGRGAVLVHIPGRR